MEVSPYLSFKGDCEDAFAFYERVLGATRGPVFRWGGSPMAGQAPPDWGDKVMHASVTIAGQTIMGADMPSDMFTAPQGFSLSLQIPVAAEAERVFAGLAEGGTVKMPLEKTFWADRFGLLVDRFGIPWQVNCEGAAQQK
jgi:PhnB protein